jgi:hypothetical protein
MYGFYSEKQLSIIKRHHDKPYIYYKDKNGEIFQITEVTDDLKNYHNNFNDVIKIGKLKNFYCASKDFIINK